MLKIYIAAPYRADTEDGVFQNIIYARSKARQLFQAFGESVCPFVPHLNTAFMGGLVPDSHFLKIDLEWLQYADLLWVAGELSAGVKMEIDFAREHRIPIAWNFHEVRAHVERDRDAEAGHSQ